MPLLACIARGASPSPPVLGKLIDVGGRRVHLYCTGQGSPTVVVASGGFSFDWGLIQPEIAQVTRICTYDTAGTAWSDPVPGDSKPTCANKVAELHQLLNHAGIGAPYVLVGYSYGGLVARLYALQYPDEIVGMVFVDHAFVDAASDPTSGAQQSTSSKGVDSPPVLISQTPIALDLEDDRNFSRLPKQNQELHRWARSISPGRPTPEMAAECFSELAQTGQKSPFPFGSKPVAVISTSYDSPAYTELQQTLLRLSRNSKQYVADHSSHMVLIDQPDIVVDAIKAVLTGAKNGAPLARP